MLNLHEFSIILHLSHTHKLPNQMKVKKTLFVLLLVIAVSATTFAQQVSLRKVVAVVRPNFSESTTKFLTDFGTQLENKGYDTAAERMKMYAKGVFGSGFIYTNPSDGKSYVVTNKHVISQAESVNVEFMLEDQSVRAFNKCKILVVDETLDLALIEIPSEAKFEMLIPLMTERPADADDIYTAGYPGLGANPSWQMGKGIVSNANLIVEEMADYKGGLIQHTAQVDHGSSGGPLLIKTNEGEFKVVGINTWKARGRENVNLSIASSHIMKFIDNYLNNQNKSTREGLENRVNDLALVSNDGYKKILPFVSYDFISHISVEAFFLLFNNADETIQKEIVEKFDDGMPIEGVRIALAESISKQLNQKTLQYKSMENFSETETVKVNVNFNGKDVVTEWQSLSGKWMLTNFADLNLSAQWKKGNAGHFGYTSSYMLSRSIGYEPYTSINLQRTFYTYYTYAIGAHSGADFVGVNFQIGGQYPYQISPKGYIIPYARTFLALDLAGGLDSDATNGLNGGFNIGTEYAHHLKDDKYIVFGLGYKPKKYISTLEGDTYSVSHLDVHIMITF